MIVCFVDAERRPYVLSRRRNLLRERGYEWLAMSTQMDGYFGDGWVQE